MQKILFYSLIALNAYIHKYPSALYAISSTVNNDNNKDKLSVGAKLCKHTELSRQTIRKEITRKQIYRKKGHKKNKEIFNITQLQFFSKKRGRYYM